MLCVPSPAVEANLVALYVLGVACTALRGLCLGAGLCQTEMGTRAVAPNAVVLRGKHAEYNAKPYWKSVGPAQLDSRVSVPVCPPRAAHCSKDASQV